MVDDNSKTCVICMDEISESDATYKMDNCGHVFHTDCIVRSIQTGNITCPCCRSLPGFMVDQEDVDDSRYNRLDILHEHNKKQKVKLLKKAFALVKKGKASNLLIKYYNKYFKEYFKYEEVTKFNKLAIGHNKQIDKGVDEIMKEERKELSIIRNKYSKKIKDYKKNNKRFKTKYRSYRSLSSINEAIVSYMGYKPAS